MSTDPDAPVYGPPFAGYQAEIFLRGMAGETPDLTIGLIGHSTPGELGRSVVSEQ
jgi:hypothetical protein